MKEEYLKKINEFYIKICGLTSSDNASILEYSVKQILWYISKLNEIESNLEYVEAYSSLNHTLKKEVIYTKSAYDRTLKRNAAKVRKIEYNQELEAAILQIRIDIGSLLQ